MWCLKPLLALFQLYSAGQCVYLSCLFDLYSAQHFFFKSLSAFPHSHWRERSLSWQSQMPLSILRKNIGQAGDRTRDLLFSSPVCYRKSYGARQQVLILFVSVYLSSLPVFPSERSPPPPDD